MFIAVFADFRVLFFIALTIIVILAVVLGIEIAGKKNQKEKLKAKLEKQEADLADRNRIISKQRAELDFLKMKRKENGGK